MIPDEVKQIYVDKLGLEFGNIFYAVENDWSHILDQYEQYMYLFNDPENLKLLNYFGPGFVSIQERLGEAMILGLCRLTDRSSCEQNASVKKLENFIHDNPGLKKQIAKYADEACKNAKVARKVRNKWIAHTDIKSEIATVPYEDIKAGLDFVYEALNAIHMAHWNRSLINKLYHSHGSPAEHLSTRLELLVKGVLFIDSLIDPTGETDPYDLEVSAEFLKRLGSDSIKERYGISSLRSIAKIIKSEEK